MRISIIGSGTVGSIVGNDLRKLGNEVIFFDVNDRVIRELQTLGLDATISSEFDTPEAKKGLSEASFC